MQLTGELSSKTCSCRKHDLRCTDMCSLYDEICENRNLNVMTEDNDEDDDESLKFKKIFSYGAPGIKLT